MLEEEHILFSFVKGGVQAGGDAKRGCRPPPPRANVLSSPVFGGQQGKIWATPVFKDVFMLFFYYYYFIFFHVFKLLT